MDSELYYIYIEDKGKSMSEVLKSCELELSKQIVKRICKAIEEGKPNIEIAKIITPDQIITLRASEPLYLQTLEINKETLIEYEEFELCAEIQRFVNILTQKKLK